MIAIQSSSVVMNAEENCALFALLVASVLMGLAKFIAFYVIQASFVGMMSEKLIAKFVL